MRVNNSNSGSSDVSIQAGVYNADGQASGADADSDMTVTNVISGNARVGMQAGVINGSTHITMGSNSRND